MTQITMCPTKKGNGIKIISGDTWYYASRSAVERVFNGLAGAVKFRTQDEIDEIKKRYNSVEETTTADKTAIGEIVWTRPQATENPLAEAPEVTEKELTDEDIAAIIIEGKKDLGVLSTAEDGGEDECINCQGQNAATGYMELWDGICPECGRIVQEPDEEAAACITYYGEQHIDVKQKRLTATCKVNK